MAAEQERLSAEIEQAKEDLARDLAELKQEASATARKVAVALGVVVAAYAAFRVVRFLARRRS
jgi:hypothetical protein